MQLSKLIGPDLRRALDDDPSELSAALEELHGEDLAELLGELDGSDVARLFHVLPPDTAADVLARLPDELTQSIIHQLGAERVAPVVAEMAADDRADLVQELPDQLAEEILEQIQDLEPEVAKDTRQLAAYGDDTAGGLMTTEFLALSPHLTSRQASDEVRRQTREGDLELIYYIYVTSHDVLLGVLSLRDLILSEPEQTIGEVMTQNVVTLRPDVDQEEVARTMARYDLAALPVVDDSQHVLGVVTIDDVVDVLAEEATEDVQKMAAMVPIEDSYFETGFFAFVRSRLTWLVVLFVGELLTASVMNVYETQIAAVMDLVIFVPLIISSGGNSGSQSSSLIIRALALGEMRPRDWLRVLYRELGMGLALGLMLSLVGFARAFLGAQVADPVAMGVTVALSVIAVVTLGTLVGSLMPLVIERLGLDPAVSSTPFVASLVDVLGLVVYFSVARFIFAFAL